MKKTLILILIIINFSSLSQKLEINYTVEFERKLTEKQRKEFEKNNVDVKFISETYETPNSESYNLKLYDNFQILSYEEPLLSDEDKPKLNVSNFPMGKISFRKQKENYIFYQFKFDNKNIYSKDTLIANNWIETERDTVILKYKAFEIVFNMKYATIKAWYVKELPKNLGLYNLSFEKGFIIAYEMYLKEDEFYNKNIVKIYPSKMKKLRKKIEEPIIEKVYSKMEIRKMYQEKNKVINQPISQ